MTVTGENDRAGEEDFTGESASPPPWRFLIIATVCLVLGGLTGVLVAGV